MPTSLILAFLVPAFAIYIAGHGHTLLAEISLPQIRAVCTCPA